MSVMLQYLLRLAVELLSALPDIVQLSCKQVQL